MAPVHPVCCHGHVKPKGWCVAGEEELPRFLQYSDEELQEAIAANQKTRATSNRPLSSALAALPQVCRVCLSCTIQ